VRKTILAMSAVSIGVLAMSGSASASLTQKVNIKLLPTTGSAAPKGSTNVLLDAYLSTRDSASTRGAFKTNPTGKFFIDFPTGSVVNKAAVPTCNQSEYAVPSILEVACASSRIGTGWALLNTGNTDAKAQLTGAATYCTEPTATFAGSAFAKTYENSTDAGPSCLPQGDVWVKITAYQGAILKSQWWCYGDAGSPKPGAACNNKQVGGDAKTKAYAFNDVTNAKKLNGCNLIFANDNSIAPLAFGGTVNQCKNRLTVILPAMNGTGAGLGELTGGLVLTDFALKISNTKFLKAGKCTSKKFTVSSQIVYSKLKGETAAPSPESNTVKYVTTCK